MEQVPSKTLYHWCNVAITRVVVKDISLCTNNKFQTSTLKKEVTFCSPFSLNRALMTICMLIFKGPSREYEKKFTALGRSETVPYTISRSKLRVLTR